MTARPRSDLAPPGSHASPVRPAPHAARVAADPSQRLAERFVAVRAATDALSAPLSEADAQVQSMPDASPAKWHLAHTSWFFETFVLERFERDFVPHHPAFRVLFNSYYEGVGARHPRAERGLVTRPSLAEVRAYRAAVDGRIAALLRHAPPDVAPLVELGVQHEQQHQELLLTDLLHAFSCNPLAPAYLPPSAGTSPAADASCARPWVAFEGGRVAIGHDAGDDFAFDNETPSHAVWLRPFELAVAPVTQAQWAAFVDDGGYRDARWWMSAGFDLVRARGWQAPLHWRRGDPMGQGMKGGTDTAGTTGTTGERGGSVGSGWRVFTLRGERPIDPDAPVAHVSWYEADAYARWHAAQHPDAPPSRLPVEAEWEHAARQAGRAAIDAGRFVEDGALRPMPARDGGHVGLHQLYGDVWQWTRSDYGPHPGFRAWDGAVGEYNAKFMAGQYVLRGASCATPRSHARATYRNFFPPDARWQFSGLRLARDVD